MVLAGRLSARAADAELNGLMRKSRLGPAPSARLASVQPDFVTATPLK